jgi:hypothetical protein
MGFDCDGGTDPAESTKKIMHDILKETVRGSERDM